MITLPFQPLRFLVCRHDIHDLACVFEEASMIKDHKNMIQKGFVSQECFNILHAECYDSSLSSKETREFLIALNLATPLPDLSSLYIPSLISGENQACVRKEMRTMEVSPDALAFYYSFKKSESVSIVQLVQQASLKVGLQRVLLRIPK